MIDKAKKVKILCVEDEIDIRENISDILRDEGFEVFEADNGKQGFDVFVKHNPDVIISDIMMPEVDGFAFLKMVRESKNANGASVPFIFLTALGQKDNVIKGINLSANDYLVKPIDFDLMIAKVKEKAYNQAKVEEYRNRSVENIKNQVAEILPLDLSNYLDVIANVSSFLKQEPYGPMPHRRYLEEFDKIYLNAMKLRSAISNALDKKTLEHRLNVDEEIISVYEFLDGTISSLSDKFKNRIVIEKPIGDLPKVRIDSAVFLDALKKILAGMFKFDGLASLRINVIHDHLDQIVIIFYLNSDKQTGLEKVVNEAEISKILDRQNCRFEIVQNRDNTLTIVIPSHRIA